MLHIGVKHGCFRAFPQLEIAGRYLHAVWLATFRRVFTAGIAVPPAVAAETSAFAVRLFNVTITRQIAEGAKGNVRAAMADLEMWIG